MTTPSPPAHEPAPDGLLPAPARAGHRLTIVSGPQAGAWTDVDLGAPVTLGSSLEDDVIVLDDGLQGRHLSLTTGSDGRIAATVLGAPLDVDGARLDTGATLSIEPGATVRLGRSALRIVALGEPDGAGGPEARRGARAGVATSMSRGRRLGVGLGASLVVASLGSMAWLSGSGLATESVPSLAARLEASFPTLGVSEENGTTVVRGALADREAGMRLRRLLDAEPGPVDDRVVVESVLAEAVLDVFRVNGVAATLVSVRGGEVALRTAVADPARLAEVRDKALRDVPALAALEIENAAPTPDSATEPDPGKRVALVVADEPAHLVTDDRSRYFLGALLPSGHRVASIEENRVMLEKDGVATELRF